MYKTRQIKWSFQAILTFFCVILSSCGPNSNRYYDYGTQNDNARSYFLRGWQEIMDYGRWTESEIAFRKASKLDPNWVLGKSMVARITKDLEERQEILNELQKLKHHVEADERLLLDVNILSHIAANNRDLGKSNTAEFNQNRWSLAEKNFGTFAKKHPEDSYFKAEYIEFLHLNHGAQIALDSIQILVTSEQRKLGFYISYEAQLQLELENIEKARDLSKKLNTMFIDSSYNSPLMVQAQIHKKQKEYKKAKKIIDKVVAKDPKHLIALGMQNELESLLKSND